MFIITVAGREKEGAYSVVDDEGEQVLYIFEEEDDAMRYSMQLEELDYPLKHVIEIESELKVQLIEEINSRGLIYETLKGVMEDYFDEFDIKTHTSIERDMNQVTYGKDDEY